MKLQTSKPCQAAIKLQKGPNVRTTVTYPIGRYCMVQADGILVGATVIDKIAGTRKAKRVRLQTGEHAGEVRMPGEYQLMEFV